jgi:preprotein translocase SecE subunit
VAKSADEKHRPRIRKSAPTVRERQETAQAKSNEPKPKRVRSIFSKLATPFKKLRLSERKAIKAAAKPLGWLVPKYFVNSWRELRQVQWPNRRETWRLTLAVFIFAVIFGALVAGVDKSLDELFKKVVLK